MQGRLTQFLPGLLALLLGKIFLERYCLLNVKGLEIEISGIPLKSFQSLGRCIDGGLAMTLGFLQISEILTLDSLMIGLCVFMV